jgi:hypothetical protein
VTTTTAHTVKTLIMLPGGDIAVSGGIVYLLTRCCGASSKGAGDGVVCRACYRALPDMWGWGDMLADVTAEGLLPIVAMLCSEGLSAENLDIITEAAMRAVERERAAA